jgi:DNA-directed RNA polymerase subunit RPC12/RpoP
MPDIISGLTCPNCSGTLDVREGQRIIKCPYCEARSLVKGESGLARYQVARRVSREQAAQAVRDFWSGLNKAFDLPGKAQITELFLAYLPYWRARAQVAGWVFGEKKITSKNSTRYEPREKQIMEEMEWTGAAGDVAEFGVNSLNLRGVQFAAYDPEALHAEGMVFEPTGSLTDAQDAAHTGWAGRSKTKSGLDRIAQTFLRFLREALSLVYYPLWVARYTYRNRAYQVVVDGQNGKVLYGKAPGNIFFRALMLVGGTALGSFIMVDGLALAIAILGSSRSSDDDAGWLVVVPVVAGAALIGGGYKLFRWGEEIEHKEKA